jgi:hypothetical protein
MPSKRKSPKRTRSAREEAWRLCASPRLLKAQAAPESASPPKGSRRRGRQPE